MNFLRLCIFVTAACGWDIRSIHAGCRSAVADEVHTVGWEGFAQSRYELAVNRVLDLEKV